MHARRSPWLAALAALVLAVPAEAQKALEVLTVARDDTFLRTVDGSGVTQGLVPITLSGTFVDGANGLARQPGTDALFAVLRLGSTRVLATVDQESGQAAAVGTLSGLNVASITFDDVGRLWAVTGDGGSPPETLFRLDPNTAAATFVMTLGNGDDGEAIAFHPGNGLLYHASGLGSPIFETIDPDTLAITPLPVGGTPAFEVLALAALDKDTLLWTDLSSGFGTVTTNGVFQFTAPLDHTAKGMVAPPPLFLATYCTAKASSVGCMPTIGSTGTPSASDANGFVVTCTNTRNQKLGLLLYSIHGRAAAPFQGGVLCIRPPAERTPASGSGGHGQQVPDCSGAYRIDMNAYARGARRGDPIPALSQIGARITCQWWCRDPGFAAPNASALSDALDYEVGP